MSVRLAANIAAAPTLELNGLLPQVGRHGSVRPVGQDACLQLCRVLSLADTELNNTYRVRVQVK
jgi:hypothetical protein